MNRPKRLDKRIHSWDDERDSGGSIVVSLHYGWSFYPHFHEGVRGFDTVKEAKERTKEIFPCECYECLNEGGK